MLNLPAHEEPAHSVPGLLLQKRRYEGLPAASCTPQLSKDLSRNQFQGISSTLAEKSPTKLDDLFPQSPISRSSPCGILLITRKFCSKNEEKALPLTRSRGVTD